jgi:hypothetical protein
VVAAKGKSISVRAIVYTILAFLAIHIALVLPSRPEQIVPLYFLRLPLELACFFLLFAVIGRIFGSLMQILVGIALAILVITRIADIATQTAFGRSFNPLLDYFLLYPGYELLTGAIGPTLAIVAAVAAAILALGCLILYYLAAVAAGRFIRRHKLVFALAGLAMALIWLPLWHSEFSMAERVRTATMDASWRSISLVTATIESTKDIKTFQEEARVDMWQDVPADKLLTALKGKDVLVVFIESYGRTALDNPLYAPSVSEVLASGTTRLKVKGIESRSAYLTSSTVGGLSWLAHGSFMSGLWIDNQRRYQSLVISDRFTLNKAFRKAGWRTLAVMPAIARAWPEGAFYGYDQIYTASTLGYAGKPFNWVTMPDQYVMSAFRKRELDVAGRKPVMTEFALISSHAPWTPIPKMIDWSMVGDGSIFSRSSMRWKTSYPMLRPSAPKTPSFWPLAITSRRRSSPVKPITAMCRCISSPRTPMCLPLSRPGNFSRACCPARTLRWYV